MRNTSLERVRIGDVLGADVVGMDGSVLLRRGTTITAAYLQALRQRGFPAVMVDDGRPDLVRLEDPLTAAVRREAAQSVRSMFASVTAVATTKMAGAPPPRTADELVARVERTELADEETVGRVHAAVDELLATVLEQPVLDGLAQIKSQSDYTYMHSVEVAALGAVLGHKLGLDRAALHDLATGCLLHDIGKALIDAAIIEKPGPLTAEEKAMIDEHPRLGMETIRRMKLGSVIPAHIAWQHHERQDGMGYPRQLFGDNRVERTVAMRVDPRSMMLLAEITAVADVHNAISSDRPYRPAMEPDAIVRTMRAMAGPHLNREIVKLLLRTVPQYPRGMWVQIVDGRRSGWIGQVAVLHPEDWCRPVVLLVYDAEGALLDDPGEYDCLDEGVDITVAPEANRVHILHAS